MKVFTMENRLPIIAPEMLTTNEFKAIWLREYFYNEGGSYKRIGLCLFYREL